jgi:tetratricopeptide (TPR) repeat protein
MEKTVQLQWQELMDAHLRKRPATAARLAQEFVEEYPDSGPAWKMLGSSLIDVARYDEAKKAIEKAIEFCPPEKLWIPLCEVGHLYKAKGNYHLASAWYHKACVAYPQEASSHIYLGSLFARMGELDQAEQKHRDAIACQYGCTDEAWLNLGLVLRAQERYSEAAEAFQEAIKIDPKYEAAKHALKDVLFFVAGPHKETP